MLFYLALSFFLFFLAFFYRRKSSLVEFFAFFVVFIICAFRFEIGCDWSGYEIHYISRLGLGFSDLPLIDPLYWSLISFLDVLDLPYQALQVSVSLIFFSSLFWFSRQFDRPLLILAFAFPLFIFGLPMTALRQALAASFIMPSFICLIRKKFIFCVLLILLAAQFHVSAVAILVLPLILYNGFNIGSILLSIPLLFLGYLTASQGEAFIHLSSRYAVAENAAAGALFRTALFAPFGLLLLIRTLPAMIKSSIITFSRGEINFLRFTSFLFLLAAPMSLLSATVIDRYAYYFSVLFGVIVNYDLSASGFTIRPYRRLLLLMLMIFGFFFVWFSTSSLLEQCYVPYKSILF